MTAQLLIAQICFAPLLALIVLALPRRFDRVKEWIALFGAAGNLGLVLSTFRTSETLTVPWVHTGIDFTLRVYHTASFITVAAAGFGLLVTLYSIPFMRNHRAVGTHYGLMLLSLGLTNGAVLANSLIVMLFFWEGLLGTLYGMIAIGHEGAWKTATKAFIIAGVTDLCMMVGVALTYAQAKTVVMTDIHLPLGGLSTVAFILLMVGAISKGGAMPFHSWIPDAAVDAPLPFMAFLPASIEKLLGVYFLSRITLDLFQLSPESWVSTMMMTVGAVTIIVAVLMALVQSDFKRLLSFCAISQVGYIILGLGTAVPVGIVGGLFHMINHAMYKSCMFLTAGSVEKQAGTTDLQKLGGLSSKIPVTFVCFLIAAASGAGVPPFSGFFSKELVYDAALERGYVFYVVAILGSFFTAASFLKLGHAAFLGPRAKAHDQVKEAPLAMLAPMAIIAALCLVFGLANALPLENLIQPMLPEHLLTEATAHGHSFAGWPTSALLMAMTGLVLVGSLVNHLFGAWLHDGKISEGGLHSVDHIQHSPGLGWIFDRAARRWFDPYELFMKAVNAFAWAADYVTWANDWVFCFSAKFAGWLSKGVRLAHTGNTSSYVVWSLAGAAVVLGYLLGWS